MFHIRQAYPCFATASNNKIQGDFKWVNIENSQTISRPMKKMEPSFKNVNMGQNSNIYISKYYFYTRFSFYA